MKFGFIAKHRGKMWAAPDRTIDAVRPSKHARDGGVCRRIWVSGRPPPSLPMCSTAPSKQSLPTAMDC